MIVAADFWTNQLNAQPVIHLSMHVNPWREKPKGENLKKCVCVDLH